MMPVKLMQHPKGPSLTEEAKARWFSSYVDLADWVEEESGLPFGVYFARSTAARTLAGIRTVTYELGVFHIEGRGYI